MKLVRVWIALVLLALGVFRVLDATGTLESTEVVDRWWPVAIVALGIAAMIAQRRISVGPVIVTAIGAALLFDQQGWTDEDLIGPFLLIIIGGALLSGMVRRRPTRAGREREESLVMFGASKIKDRSEHLEHVEVSAVFGGATLDLREAHIDRTASVDAMALFGAVDVLVPKGWRVSLGGLPIFGGYEDKTEGNGTLPSDAPTLTVNATAIFGGIDVANEPDRREV